MVKVDWKLLSLSLKTLKKCEFENIEKIENIKYNSPKVTEGICIF